MGFWGGASRAGAAASKTIREGVRARLELCPWKKQTNKQKQKTTNKQQKQKQKTKNKKQKQNKQKTKNKKQTKKQTKKTSRDSFISEQGEIQ